MYSHKYEHMNLYVYTNMFRNRYIRKTLVVTDWLPTYNIQLTYGIIMTGRIHRSSEGSGNDAYAQYV